MAMKEFPLVLDREYGSYWMYVSEGQEGYRDINGVYILKRIFDGEPPERLLMTMRW